MAYPMSDPTTSSLKQLIVRLSIVSCASKLSADFQMSTSPTNNSRKLIGSREADRTSGIDASDFTPEAVTFTRYYFTGTKIPIELLNNIVKLFLSDNQFYEKFVKSVLCNELLERYPIRKSYRRNLLKLLITELERLSMDVSDELYTIYASCMVDTMEWCYRIFLTSDLAELLVVIRESTQQLCHGTTGLSLWQASCDLANFLCQFENLLCTKVLELGAGCGLTGIAIARTFHNCNVTLSDYDSKVLKQLEFNVQENLDETCSSIEVLNIDWTSFDITQLNSEPDVVIAADVVYDSLILPALCGVLKSCLQTSRKSRAYVASTLRDPLTLATFRKNIDIHGLRIKDEVRYQYETFTFLDGSKFRSATSFPHSSSLEAPTIIYEIVQLNT
ncbi:hypothetical protein V3C99_001969 [Haemonchus contortus]